MHRSGRRRRLSGVWRDRAFGHRSVRSCRHPREQRRDFQSPEGRGHGTTGLGIDLSRSRVRGIQHDPPRASGDARAQGGVIVNIASFVAVRPPGPGRVHYASAKAALFGLTRALGLEVAQDGVRVVGVAPGLTDTEIVRKGLPNLAERVSRVPLGRMARPEEIAHTVRYAIENDFLTAETIIVAGGE